MDAKTPVMLVMLVQTTEGRWFATAVAMDGTQTPLLRSEAGDLDAYRDLEFDEQVSFLRHRFCGALQRACDRLWPQKKKACQFVILFEEPLDESRGPLTSQVAEHFALWMSKPPVAALLSKDGFGHQSFAAAKDLGQDAPRLERLAGDLEPQLEELLQTQLTRLFQSLFNVEAWELPRKKAPLAGGKENDR